MNDMKVRKCHMCKSANQICSKCGKTFHVFYNAEFDSAGNFKYYYDYPVDACDCEAEFSPADGEPSLSEWAEQIRNPTK